MSSTIRAGARLGRYEIQRLLGLGGRRGLSVGGYKTQTQGSRVAVAELPRLSQRIERPDFLPGRRAKWPGADGEL